MVAFYFVFMFAQIRKLTALCVVFSLVAMPQYVSASESEEVVSPVIVNVLVDANYAPVSFAVNGKAAGLHADILTLVDEHLPQYSLRIQAINWKSGLNQIKSGDAHIIMGTINTGKLRPYMYPYSSPIYAEEIIIICGTQVSVEEPVSWPESFSGKLMLNIAGYDGWLHNRVRHPNFTRIMNFLEVPNVNIAIDMVEKGNADCSLYEKSILAGLRKEREADNPINVSTIMTVQHSDLHLGYSYRAWQDPKNSYLQDFARAFDFAMVELKLDGEIDRLLAQYDRL